MSSLTIHDIDDELKARLRDDAALHRRSIEEHARALLQSALIPRSTSLGLADRIHQRFAGLDASQLQLPPRDEQASAAELPE